MYTSLLSNVSDNVKNNTNNESFLNVVVKMLYEIALILPLAALVIVLVARIGILWVIIAIAPLMMLLRVFDSKKTIIDKDSIFSLENIAKLLIAPVLVSFAVSFSTMLIQIIQTLNELTIASEPTNFYNLFELNIKGAGFKFGKVVVSMFSVGIVWFLLFRAIKMNQIGKKI
ncbi:MAG: hypothetical protein LBP53_02115 [Candidatus Peribacteria bacterium]|nr:hypothetical protein [Candidatus Peribacteria bacterium]